MELAVGEAFVNSDEKIAFVDFPPNHWMRNDLTGTVT